MIQDIIKLASKYAKVNSSVYINTVRNFKERAVSVTSTDNKSISSVIQGWEQPTDYSDMREVIEYLKSSDICCYVYNVRTLVGFIKHTSYENTELLACLLVAVMEGDLKVEGKLDYFNV